MRDRLSPAVIAFAERRAREIGTTADRVLVAAGVLSEDDYVRALARHIQVPFAPLGGLPRGASPLDDDALVDAAAAGMMPIRGDGALEAVVVPRGAAARRLVELAGSPAAPRGLRLTTGERLRGYVLRHAAPALGRRAAFGLATERPDVSAAPRPWRPVRLVAAAAALAGPALACPDIAATVLGILLALVFLAWTALRLLAVALPAPVAPRLARQPDGTLPLYTVVVALHREAATVPQIVAALDGLDWPPEKLQVIVALEADDRETQAAFAAQCLGPHWEILVVPDMGPRTKPKALNAALPFARGAFLAVYDAEDRPEPDQLRRAAAAFAAGGERLACVQARLSIDNTGDGLLTALFTAEYAGLFDVFLPVLARLRLPLPLGGSSNHFRTAALRAAGGWDAYNLTEDADLGMRLARCGFRIDVIASTTQEEAPARLAPWLRQRTRWFQGWIQTWLVHMRTPRRTLRDLGPAGFVTLQLVVGGTVLAALVHPVFSALLIGKLAGEGLPPLDDLGTVLLAGLYGSTFVAGWAASMLLGLSGLARRRLLGTAWVLLLVPVHWLLLSLAAWRALIKFFRDPYRWDKTEHGLARTSRSAPQRGAVPEESTGRGARRGLKKPEVEPATSQ
ncbi:cellulose synthase/poly-beta-1,6-N-acetylglucosamine synthase-like glycosyltransferase [Rhodoplanes tepidamans]|uniref:Glycosyltransferase n=2 Tax=Rhodoplanes TaxID=29407 RepID=A0ABT5JE49_RHOTP|nr:glycosyltransferase [Rhodoplanes tepidamans]MDC7787892.1 glycosyltransferase [Rhodoplanes tepidamans]MDQ0353735.1 cellulose synthase/poly-beta-1,6-N-acetylglucosamine synthase-like glycosyltransferase [Rhodoplanes tepidamans]